LRRICRYGKQRSRVEKGGGLIRDEQHDDDELVSILLDGGEQRSIGLGFGGGLKDGRSV
jgi:hypothetical protein